MEPGICLGVSLNVDYIAAQHGAATKDFATAGATIMSNRALGSAPIETTASLVFTQTSKRPECQLQELQLFASTSADANPIPIRHVHNPGGRSPLRQVPAMLIDGNIESAWSKFINLNHVTDGQTILEFGFQAPVSVLAYQLFTANDNPGRDPTAWYVSVLVDGQWYIVHVRSGVVPPAARHSAYGVHSLYPPTPSASLEALGLQRYSPAEKHWQRYLWPTQPPPALALAPSTSSPPPPVPSQSPPPPLHAHASAPRVRTKPPPPPIPPRPWWGAFSPPPPPPPLPSPTTATIPTQHPKGIGLPLDPPPPPLNSALHHRRPAGDNSNLFFEVPTIVLVLILLCCCCCCRRTVARTLFRALHCLWRMVFTLCGLRGRGRYDDDDMSMEMDGGRTSDKDLPISASTAAKLGLPGLHRSSLWRRDKSEVVSLLHTASAHEKNGNRNGGGGGRRGNGTKIYDKHRMQFEQVWPLREDEGEDDGWEESSAASGETGGLELMSNRQGPPPPAAAPPTAPSVPVWSVEAGRPAHAGASALFSAVEPLVGLGLVAERRATSAERELDELDQRWVGGLGW